MQVAIYCRVSTAAQEEDGTSQDTQEAACRKYANQQGWLLDDACVYREQYSGYTRERPRLLELRRLVRERAVATVLIYAVDRLSRNQTDLAILLDEMKNAGVRLECVTEKIEDTAMGKFLLTARAFAAELEREKIRERTVRGKRERTMQGKIATGGPICYGYRSVPGDGKQSSGVWEVAPLTGPIAQDIFRWMGDEGLTLGQIANRLHDRGIPSPTGRAWWNPSTLSQLLRNTVYIGILYRYTRTRSNDGPRTHAETSSRTGSRPRANTVSELTPRYRAREDWLAIDGAAPALISPDLWQRVQHRLAYNQEMATRNAKTEYLLRGRVSCALCGLGYSGYREQRRNYVREVYRCNHAKASRFHLGSTPRCTGPTVRADVLDAAVWNFVSELLENPALIVAELERQRAMQNDTDFERDLQSVQEQLDRIAWREQRLLALTLDTDDDESLSLYQKERAVLTAQRARLHAEKTRLETQILREVITPLTTARITEYCQMVRSQLSMLSIEEKRIALDALRVAVRIEDRGTVRISGFVPTTAVAFNTSRHGRRAYRAS